MKRFLLLVLCGVMIAGMVGCAGTPAATPAPAPAASAAAPAATAKPAAAPTAAPATAAPKPAEPVTITMINRLNADYVVENNPIVAELAKRANVKLEIEAPPINNYNDRLNIVMASGDLPDIIYNNADKAYRQWAADGLLLKLDDYLTKMPNVTSVLTEMELKNTRVVAKDNGLYALPRIQTKPPDTIMYRKDWLDKLGLSVPATPEEFAAAMKAFSDNDPDGNGKKDTFGWSLNPAQIFSRNNQFAFDLLPETVKGSDGQYNKLEMQQNYMAFLDWLAAMFKDGSMDPEWYLNKQYEDSDKFAAGKVGVNYKDITTTHLIMAKSFYDANPTAVVVGGPPLKKAGTDKAVDYYAIQAWGAWAVSADTKNPDAVIQFLDYGYTDEACTLLLAGLQGVTYNSFDEKTRTAVRDQAMQDAAKKYTASYACFNYQLQNKGMLMNAGSTPEDVKFAMDAIAEMKAKTTYVDYVPSWEAVYPGLDAARSKNVDLDTENTEKRTKFICGELSRDEYVKFLNEKFIPAYQDYMGIIRAASK